MTAIGQRIADAAEKLVGAPFRLHGRNPTTGLDCVGVVAASLWAAGVKPTVPTGYAMRNRSAERFVDYALMSGLVEVSGNLQAGDVLLVRAGPAQLHLLITHSLASFIHAHAGLRRVVDMPGPLLWPVLNHWRVGQDI